MILHISIINSMGPLGWFLIRNSDPDQPEKAVSWSFPKGN